MKRAALPAPANARALASTDSAPELDAVLAGDSSAWRQFVKYYDARLRIVVRNAAEDTETFSSADVDDVLGDFWLAAVSDDMRMLRAFKPERGAALLTWLAFHVAHVATEHIRRKRKEQNLVPLDEVRRMPASTGASVDDAIRAVVREAITREMRQSLPAVAQPAAVASVAEYVSADRAAQIAGVRPATIREWVSQKRLPGHRAGRLLRIRTDELHCFLSGGSEKASVVDIEARRRRALARLR